VAEELEGLDELVEILDLDGAVAAEDGGERTIRADEGSGVRERGSGGTSAFSPGSVPRRPG
jgi:hypothetical protein